MLCLILPLVDSRQVNSCVSFSAVTFLWKSHTTAFLCFAFSISCLQAHIALQFKTICRIFFCIFKWIVDLQTRWPVHWVWAAWTSRVPEAVVTRPFSHLSFRWTRLCCNRPWYPMNSFFPKAQPSHHVVDLSSPLVRSVSPLAWEQASVVQWALWRVTSFNRRNSF